jgi:hypothetical protein
MVYRLSSFVEERPLLLLSGSKVLIWDLGLALGF